MDFNRAFFVKKETHKSQWVVINARGRILGRLATEIADRLRGKDKPTYTPHADSGDHVIILNARDIVLTGNKWENKMYDRYSGWMGGYKIETAKELQAKHPTRIIELAVKRMLPKNKLSDALLKKLHIYVEGEHPHQAQIR